MSEYKNGDKAQDAVVKEILGEMKASQDKVAWKKGEYRGERGFFLKVSLKLICFLRNNLRAYINLCTEKNGR